MQNGLERMRSIWAQAKRKQVLHADHYLEMAAQAWGTKSTSNIEMNPDLCAAFASILQREIEKQLATTMTATQAMVDRFLTWPLPDSVCADLCATTQGHPHRSGTNLLTATEAKQMLEHVLYSAPRVSTIPCAECGGPVVEFSVPNDVWNKVMRPDGREHDKEYLCVQCFANHLVLTINKDAAIREFIRISVIGRGDVPEDVRKGAITVLAIPVVQIVACKVCGITLHDKAADAGYCSDHARGVFMV